MGWIIYYKKVKNGKEIGDRKEKRFKTLRGAENFIRNARKKGITIKGKRIF